MSEGPTLNTDSRLAAIREQVSDPILSNWTTEEWLLALVESALARERQLKQWIRDLQGEMSINCVFCGHYFGPGDPAPPLSAFVAHLEECAGHPAAVWKARALAAEAERDALLARGRA